jgi:hypothetical protein
MKYPVRRPDVEATVELYIAEAGEAVIDSVIGFIRMNQLVETSPVLLMTIIDRAVAFAGGTLKGEGDRFKEWCTHSGRDIPVDPIVAQMNREPDRSKDIAVEHIREYPQMWLGWMTYFAGKGRRHV